jgi:hypothetical protein
MGRICIEGNAFFRPTGSHIDTIALKLEGTTHVKFALSFDMVASGRFLSVEMATHKTE